MLALSWGRVSLNDQVFLSLPLFLVSICWNPFSRLKSEWILKLFRRASLLTGSSPHPPCGLWDPSCSSLFSSSLYHVPFSPSPWFPWSSHTEILPVPWTSSCSFTCAYFLPPVTNDLLPIPAHSSNLEIHLWPAALSLKAMSDHLFSPHRTVS